MIALFVFIATGALIGFIFDLFRLTRKAFKTPNIITYFEDFLFWIISGTMIIHVQCVYIKGEIRLYLILALIMGTLIYFLTLSRFFMGINSKIINFLKNFSKKTGN